MSSLSNEIKNNFIYLFDNDDMKSSKRRVTLLTSIFLLEMLSEIVFYNKGFKRKL